MSSARQRRPLPQSQPTFFLRELSQAITGKFPRLRPRLAGSTLVLRGDNPQRFLTIQAMRHQKSSYVRGLFVVAMADGRRILASRRLLFRRFARPEVRSPRILLGARRAVWTSRTKSPGTGGTQDFIDLDKLVAQLKPICLEVLLPRPDRGPA